MRRISLSFFLVFTLTLSQAREYHVAKNGNDAAPGTIAEPLGTINAAAQKALPGDTVTVHEGVYREWVDPLRGGKNESTRILYRAADGENVELKGSETVTGWKKLKSGLWTAVIPNRVFGTFNPFSELFVGDWLFPPIDLHLGEVYLNGRSMYEAKALDSLNVKRFSHRDPDGVIMNWYASVGSDNTTITANFGGLDPNKETIEVTVRPTCFYPSREGVNYITLRGFKISQAAARWAAPTAEQVGMVSTHWSKGWIIEDNEISESKSAGITLGKEAGTGQDVWTYDQRFDGAIHYLECIFRALRHGWDKSLIGSNIVRNNHIHDCGQAGICGSMGCSFSEVYGNEIHTICTKDEFSGCEQGGIKFHGGIDAYIHNNVIYDCIRGLWMDWMGQGSRISCNIFYDNWDQDIFFEMDHGPYVVDNNLLLSDRSFFDMSEGGAFLNNFIAGRVWRQPDTRYVPYMLQHSTQVKGISVIDQSDNRFINNVFMAKDGDDPLKTYEGSAFAPKIEDNATVAESAVKIDKDGKNVSVKITGLSRNCKVVTTSRLGLTHLSDFPYENADGTPLAIDYDFNGKHRSEQTFPGPFEN